MAMSKPRGNKKPGGKKPKGRTSTAGARTVSVNPDVKASRRRNADAYTTKRTTKRKTGTGTTVAKKRSVSKGKTSTTAGASGRPRRPRG